MKNLDGISIPFTISFLTEVVGNIFILDVQIMK